MAGQRGGTDTGYLGSRIPTCLETWPISDGYFSLIIPEKLNWRTQETGWSPIPTCPQDPQKARVPPLGSQASSHLSAPGLGALLRSAARGPSFWTCSAGRSVQAYVPPPAGWGYCWPFSLLSAAWWCPRSQLLLATDRMVHPAGWSGLAPVGPLCPHRSGGFISWNLPVGPWVPRAIIYSPSVKIGRHSGQWKEASIRQKV